MSALCGGLSGLHECKTSSLPTERRLLPQRCLQDGEGGAQEGLALPASSRPFSGPLVTPGGVGLPVYVALLVNE